jgi:hypothetical protein
MVCPVEIAHEMSAFVPRIAVKVPAGGRPIVFDLESAV